jgi:predicted acetyltransferase
MDRELQQYYEDQLALFTHPGWKTFVEHAKASRDAEARIEDIESLDKLHQVKGRLRILDWIISWESMVKQAHSQNSEDQDE